MPLLVVAFIIVTVITASADHLEELKAAAVRYLAAMKAALTVSDDSDCSQLIAKANEYSAAKIAYYTAARKALPTLLEVPKDKRLIADMETS